LGIAVSSTDRTIGPYQIIRQLGRGGMGTVYLAQHRELGYRRAVKVLNTADDRSLLERFRREGQVAIELNHPNILRAEHYDLDADGRPYIVMPYVGDDDGPRDLNRYLEEHGDQLDAATTARLTQQILEGLGHAHEQGLVHRDLKPANILIEEGSDGPIARIADFGLVSIMGEAAFRDRIYQSISQSLSLGSAPTIAEDRRAPDAHSRTIPEDGGSSRGTSTQSLIGTWSYMAPEQKQPGATVDHRADLHAVGLLAYRMLMGRLPGSVTKMPGRTDPALAKWDSWLETMLADEPEERFSSAAEALRGLAALTTSRRSSRRLAAIATVVVVLITIGAVFAIIRPWEEQPGTTTIADSTPSSEAIPSEDLPSVEEREVRFSSVADLDELSQQARALAREEPDLTIHDALSKQWQAAIDTRERAQELELAGQWQSAGERYERAIEQFQSALSLASDAQAAAEQRVSFESESTQPVDWVDHPVISSAQSEIDEHASRAGDAFEQSEFETAEAYWRDAKQRLAKAKEANMSARVALDALSKWQAAIGELDSIGDGLYVAVRDDIESMRTSVSSAQEQFDVGEFSAAAETWTISAEHASASLSKHHAAMQNATESRESWTLAVDALPDPLYDGAQSKRDKAISEAGNGENQFDRGSFEDARELWAGAVSTLQQVIETHETVLAKSEQTKRAWEQVLTGSETPSVFINDSEVNRLRQQAQQKANEAEQFHAAARFDDAVTAYGEAESAWQQAVRAHEQLVSTLLATARSERADKDDRKRSIDRLLALDADRREWVALREQIASLFGPNHGDTRTIHFGRGVTMEMIYIGPGEFTMGSRNGERGRYRNEGPARQVTVKDGFWMATAPVTQSLWQAIMNTSLVDQRNEHDRRLPLWGVGPNHPMYYVDWHESRSFADKLTSHTRATRAIGPNERFRLPSEAEWEYACRAGKSTRYFFGDDESRLAEYAWFRSNSPMGTQPVRTRKANPWGLFDMHGNVWEWCEDVWHSNYDDAPSDQSPRLNGRDTKLRVIRGGSCIWAARDLRAAVRQSSKARFDHQVLIIGIRLVLESE
jgi:formylglycine-generating enzyme required for sulfatase activity/serine/threonine protein kinase